MPQLLTNRQLNRATLARQWMLERADVAIPDAVAFLLGLQAQTTNGPYQALWNRLNGVTHQDLTALTVDRTLLRATTLRTTLRERLLTSPLGNAQAFTKTYESALLEL